MTEMNLGSGDDAVSLPESADSNQQEVNIDPSQLSFEALETLYTNVIKAADTTFARRGLLYQSVAGECVGIKQDNGVYKVSYISPGLKHFHGLIVNKPHSVIVKGSSNSEEMMQAIKEELAAMGNRVLEDIDAEQV